MCVIEKKMTVLILAVKGRRGAVECQRESRVQKGCGVSGRGCSASAEVVELLVKPALLDFPPRVLCRW